MQPSTWLCGPPCALHGNCVERETEAAKGTRRLSPGGKNGDGRHSLRDDSRLGTLLSTFLKTFLSDNMVFIDFFLRDREEH